MPVFRRAAANAENRDLTAGSATTAFHELQTQVMEGAVQKGRLVTGQVVPSFIFDYGDQINEMARKFQVHGKGLAIIARNRSHRSHRLRGERRDQ